MQQAAAALADQGYAIVPAVFSAAEMDSMTAAVEDALASQEAAPSLLTRQGAVYGARNLLQFWPGVATAWRQPTLVRLVHFVLGAQAGLVRVLYFDKHQESWSLPWHKDMTIAVREHRPVAGFGKPTIKAGVPHLEAPVELLENMLTLRIHLDRVTPANGPMLVLPGSHHTGKQLAIDEAKRVSIEVERGDVLALRPLLAHASAASHPESRAHRRVLHLEFSGQERLPDCLAWHTYVA